MAPLDRARAFALTDTDRGGNTGAQAHANLASRLWRRDVSMWHQPAARAAALAARLGWLDSIDWMRERAGELQAWAGAIAASGHYRRVILLGMGGSSLAPAVFASLFAPGPGGLPLTVIDTTHPGDLAGRAGRDWRRCLFIVSSKSGATVETVDLYHFFRAGLAAQGAEPSPHFVMITDRDSPLHRLAGDCKRVFINPSDIGGRYSALSYFGLVPAALLGVNIGRLLARARDFCATTRTDDPRQNPALALGLLLGRSALAGRDKLILHLPDALSAFGLWVEQLIAESCGKDGRGLIPVMADCGARFGGGRDRISVRVGDGGDSRAGRCDYAVPLQAHDRYQIGAEFFRWEFATAVAASCLRVNPFDQPDVARAKARTAAFIGETGRAGGPLPHQRGACLDEYDLVYHGADSGQPGHSARDLVAAFARTLTPATYLALLAYLPEDPATVEWLHCLRRQAAGRAGIVATCGIGPRYLHSTGQLHKGGPPSGRFIQLIADPDPGADVPVPERAYTFGQLHRAQADGDFAALVDAGRPVMRVALKADRLRALAAFASAFKSALAVAAGRAQDAGDSDPPA